MDHKPTLPFRVTPVVSNSQRPKKVNQFLVLDTIGQGTFSKVKRCYNQETKDEFALKIYNKNILQRKKEYLMQNGKMIVRTALDKIHNELSLLFELQHPQLCRAYEILENPVKNKYYLVLQLAEKGPLFVYDGDHQKYIPGKYLQNLMSSSPSLEDPLIPEDICIKFLHQISLALQYLHSKNICHRDVKLDNVLVLESGDLLLTDFNCASLMDENKRVRGTEGTYAFLSPEAVSISDSEYKGHNGVTTDVWALGVSLYFLVYGEMPFCPRNKHLKDFFDEIEKGEIKYKKKNISQELDAILRGLLRKDERMTLDDVLSFTSRFFGPDGKQITGSS